MVQEWCRGRLGETIEAHVFQEGKLDGCLETSHDKDGLQFQVCLLKWS